MNRPVRIVVASTGAALAYSAVHTSFAVVPGPPIGAGIVAGIVAALAGPVGWAAALSGALGVLLGALFDLAAAFDPARDAADFLLGAPVAAATAFVAANLLRRDRQWRHWLSAAAFALLVGGMCTATAVHVQRPIFADKSMLDFLSTPPTAYNYSSDEAMYMRTYALMRQDGANYYEAARKARTEIEAYAEQADALPGGAISFRLPAGYMAWALFPGPFGVTLVPLLLLMGVLSMASAFFIANRLVGHAAGVAAAATVSMYYTEIASTLKSLHVEPWSAAFTLAALAAYVWARTADSDRILYRLMWVSAILAFAAASIRELQVFFLLAGVVTALIVDRKDRPRLVWPWAAALGAFGVLYASHVMIVGEGLLTQRVYGYWLKVDLVRAVFAVSHGTSQMAGSAWLPFLLTVFAGLGVLTLRNREVRLMMVLGVLLPAVAYTFLGPSGTAVFNDHTGLFGGGQITASPAYWGALTSPVLLSLSALGAPLVMNPKRVLELFPRKVADARPLPHPVTDTA